MGLVISRCSYASMAVVFNLGVFDFCTYLADHVKPVLQFLRPPRQTAVFRFRIKMADCPVTMKRVQS